LYEARLKAKRDEEARLDYARSEGLEEGLAKGREEGLAKGREEGREEGRTEGEQIGLSRGEKIGQIRLLERLLDRPPTADTELSTASLEELAKKLEALQLLFPRSGG
jgi:flagellar biosynthesis/type III secretory pathway protein FliH